MGKDAGSKNVGKATKRDIINTQYRKKTRVNSFKSLSDTEFNNLTIAAKKKGAIIIRGTKEAEEHLLKNGAEASTIGDVLIFGKKVRLLKKPIIMNKICRD